jgi:hypothetical protein
MSRKYQNRFVLPVLVLLTFLVVAQRVQACQCPGGDNSTLGKFESARFVVVNKIISVNKEPRVRIVYSGAEEIHEPFIA